MPNLKWRAAQQSSYAPLSDRQSKHDNIESERLSSKRILTGRPKS